MSEPSWSVTTDDAQATRRLAQRIGADARPGTVLALVGDLGAGKTTFVQGLAEGLGVHQLSEVLSPTYTLVNEYPADGPTLVHLDFYRLDESAKARALGLDEQLSRGDAVVAVEWADQMPELIPADAVWVRISWQDETRRTLKVEGMQRLKGFSEG